MTDQTPTGDLSFGDGLAELEAIVARFGEW